MKIAFNILSMNTVIIMIFYRNMSRNAPNDEDGKFNEISLSVCLKSITKGIW